ncbi:MAG: hypothetical protein NDF55_10835 [archaeon GB-1867-005]|nr:hypothetical protein [Candidatus Culexmicrobium cathedralense]
MSKIKNLVKAVLGLIIFTLFLMAVVPSAPVVVAFWFIPIIVLVMVGWFAVILGVVAWIINKLKRKSKFSDLTRSPKSNMRRKDAC